MIGTAEQQHTALASGELEYATFYVGDLLLGIDIRDIQEIGRQLELTPVPQAPACVRGVVNLRGEVVTVLDLRTMLGLEIIPITHTSRNLIVNANGERIGLLVDSMADVVTAEAAQIDAPPPNLPVADASVIQGVYRMEGKLLGVLAIQSLLDVEK